MAPKNLLGLLLLVAAFSPGYVYLRFAERWHTRPSRSSLLEGVELLSIGALISATVALAAIALGDATGALDTARLFNHPEDYVAAEPIRCLFALLISAVGAYALAALAAHTANVVKKRQSPDREQVTPGVTVWQQTLRTGNPESRNSVVLNVELRDGRILTGLAYSWTAHDAENRELALQQTPAGGPILMREGIDAPPQPIRDMFVLLREDDILGVYGSWLAAVPPPLRASPGETPLGSG
ncbi:MAG: hypothetical protein QOH80_1575 [Actinomycetota bacterium]|nr:hypothetical protein [Actinomycetota bacterium]